MKDWKGNVLKLNDEIYLTEDGLVKSDDMEEYIGLVYSRMTVLEYEELIKERNLKSV